ncbi:ATP-binding protein [Aeromicrobium sp.]|uniref:sensor histidine kinase n=1 Tax=Aeromicrobium sp. TaxID=1871063 RepID=UPI003D6BDCD9
MRRLTLAGQLLLLQMGLVVLVVIAVAGVSTAQTDASFRRSLERQMLSSAETIAGNDVVQQDLRTGGRPEALKVEADLARSFADATYVIVVDDLGRVQSATLPLQSGTPLAVGEGTTLNGTAWSGAAERYGKQSVEGHVPVISEHPDDLGTRVGYVIVGSEYPSWWEVLGTATPSVLLYLLLAGVVGVAGSLLVARRVKRQTLGLEPREISALVEQREAMLHGVREGVVGVDLRGRVAFANDEAIRLLDLEESPVGRDVGKLDVAPELAEILAGEGPRTDAVAAVESRLLVLNSMPVLVRGTRTGTVVSMRDRTELLDLQQQLAVAQDHTDTLRSQVHEFQNRLHAISGMVELGERQELLEFIGSVSQDMDRRVSEIGRLIGDPAIAALLVAKAIRADELSVDLVLGEESVLHPHSPGLSSDLVTVVGNLVDNAFESVGSSGGTVTVDLRDDGEQITVSVEDTGAGIDPEDAARIFEAGWTSKPIPESHGWGLALTRMACQRHGGDVRVERGAGARLVATLLVGRGALPSADRTGRRDADVR